MTEQEATELIATKLMGWIIKDSHYQDNNGKLLFFRNSPGEFIHRIFNPFHDSNHARMVKDKLAAASDFFLMIDYFYHLGKRIGVNIPKDLCTWEFDRYDLIKFHNAPNDVCMWAVVDVLNEMEEKK